MDIKIFEILTPLSLSWILCSSIINNQEYWEIKKKNVNIEDVEGCAGFGNKNDQVRIFVRDVAKEIRKLNLETVIGIDVCISIGIGTFLLVR